MLDLMFVDVDGVVADLPADLGRVHGLPVEKWPAGLYDLEKIFGKKQSEIWQHSDVLGADFWADLPIYPWAKDLIAFLDRTFGADQVIFLTQPVRDPQCLAGKAIWLRTHFPHRNYAIGPNKTMISRPGSWLLDDSEKNVSLWSERAPGYGVLFPSRQNKLHGETDPLGYVQHFFRFTQTFFRHADRAPDPS